MNQRTEHREHCWAGRSSWCFLLRSVRGKERTSLKQAGPQAEVVSSRLTTHWLWFEPLILSGCLVVSVEYILRANGCRMPGPPSFSLTPSTFCPTFLSFPLTSVVRPVSSSFWFVIYTWISFIARKSLQVPSTASRGDNTLHLAFKIIACHSPPQAQVFTHFGIIFYPLSSFIIEWGVWAAWTSCKNGWN